MKRTVPIFLAILSMLILSCGETVVIPTFSQCQGLYMMDQPFSGSGVTTTLDLRDDYTAVLYTEFTGGEPPIDKSGTWIIGSDGLISVRLTQSDGVTMYPVLEMDLVLNGNELEAVNWDQDIFGSEGPSFHRI